MERERDDQPVMLSLTDLRSGDCMTVGLFDSVQDDLSHVLAVFDGLGHMCAYGPFEGLNTAEGYASRLAAADDDVAVTKAMRLLGPEVGTLPADEWVTVPEDIAAAAHPAPADAAVVVVFLDRQERRCCVVGPFDTPAAAIEWRVPADVDVRVERLLAPVRPPLPAS